MVTDSCLLSRTIYSLVIHFTQSEHLYHLASIKGETNAHSERTLKITIQFNFEFSLPAKSLAVKHKQLLSLALRHNLVAAVG